MNTDQAIGYAAKRLKKDSNALRNLRQNDHANECMLAASILTYHAMNRCKDAAEAKKVEAALSERLRKQQYQAGLGWVVAFVILLALVAVLITWRT